MISDFTVSISNSNHLLLELRPEILAQLWEQSQSLSSPYTRWQAYRNKACLSAFLPWIQAQIPTAKIWPANTNLGNIWEVVNGIALSTKEQQRFILISTDNIDLTELEVPQEWVDIPSWAGDYYIGIQFNPDDGYIKVFGYATRAQLKEKAIYNPTQRVYCLDCEDLIAELDVLWVSLTLGLDCGVREEIKPLPLLPLLNAENLITRLGNANVRLPRLEVPFELWGALLEHAGWRQRLYEKRLGMADQWVVSQWLLNGISQVAQMAGWNTTALQPKLMGSKGSSGTTEAKILFKPLTIAGNIYHLRVIPYQDFWRFELRGTTNMLEPGFKLRLLTEDLQPFENNEDIATQPTEAIYIDVAIAPGEGIVAVVEPQPDNYKQEILRL